MSGHSHQGDFFFQGEGPQIILSYDTAWVIFSVALAIVGTTVGIVIAQLSKRIYQTNIRILIQLTAAIVFGSAIWSMHFIGMLAVSMPLEVTYDPVITLGSILPAILAAWFAVRWMAKKHQTQKSMLYTSAMIAVGIGAMHYSGMLAVQMDAQMKFAASKFIISLAAAFTLSLLGIWIQHRMSSVEGLSRNWSNLATGLCLGLAITAMHYIAMQSTRIIGLANLRDLEPSADRGYLGIIIGVGIFAALAVGFSGALLARLRTTVGELQLRKDQLTSILSQSMHSIITTNQDGFIESINPQTEHLFRATPGQMIGTDIRTFILDWNPNIRELEMDKVKNRETTATRQDSSLVPIVLRKSLLKENESYYFVIFLMDISEYKDTEQELYYQATHDSLTGLYNRRHMEGSALREYHAMLRHKRALSVAMLDIDHFKKVNDTYGHDIGDLVLIFLAKTLEAKLRRTDLLYRCGGEEFVILLPDTEAAEAYMLANKLCKSISQTPVQIDEKTSIQIAVSIGLYTSISEEAGGYQEMIQRADRAMYTAKNSGRNQVVAYTFEAEKKKGIGA